MKVETRRYPDTFEVGTEWACNGENLKDCRVHLVTRDGETGELTFTNAAGDAVANVTVSNP